MASFNKVILLGNITRDPELKYTPKGTAVAQIGLAINRIYTNDAGEKVEEVTFVDIDMFGRTAEICNEYCSKGDPIMIEGRLKLDQWDDKQTGQKKSRMKVICDTLQFLRSKSSDEERGRSSAPPARRPPSRPPAKTQDPDLDQPEDDIPF